MALSILDGNQSATTLSTILSSGQHITAHTVVSLGTQAIIDMRCAVSGSVVSISNFPTSQSTTFGAVTGSVSVLNFPSSQSVTFSAVSISNLPATQTIAGTVTANLALLGGFAGAVQLVNYNEDDEQWYSIAVPNAGSPYIPTRIVGGTVTVGNSVTIGSLPALPAGTAQIGSVTASISGTVPVSISSVTVGNSVTIASLPSLVAGTAQIGSVTASISNTVVTFYPMQGTAVTNSNFTSTTASTTLVSAVAGRECLTVFNEGAGNLHISPGATCTTVAYQIRLSAGDYWECPQGQLSLAHTAVFATAGTARVTEVS